MSLSNFNEFLSYSTDKIKSLEALPIDKTLFNNCAIYLKEKAIHIDQCGYYQVTYEVHTVEANAFIVQVKTKDNFIYIPQSFSCATTYSFPVGSFIYYFNSNDSFQIINVSSTTSGSIYNGSSNSIIDASTGTSVTLFSQNQTYTVNIIIVPLCSKNSKQIYPSYT